MPLSTSLPRNALQREGPTAYKWLALGTVAIGTLMATIDSSIVNIALPTLSRTFRVELATVTWVTISYLLTVTLLLLSFGRLADMVGRKRIYSWGFAVFTAGSALCGLSRSAPQLVAFRVIQAVGAAMMFANGAAILTQAFPPTERGRALGINGAVVATGLTIGPSVGGFLIDLAGWRSIFYINLPIGLVGLTAARLVLQADEPGQTRRRFDFAGALTLGMGLFGLMFALTRGRELGWSSPLILTCFGLAAVAFPLFVLIEWRSAAPMVDLSLFRNRLFSAANASGLLNFIALNANVLLMPFYLQQLRGYTPSQAGMIMTAVPLTMMVVAPFSGWLSDRIGSIVLSSTGLTVSAAAFLWLSGLDANSAAREVMLRLILLGIGSGLFQPPNNSAAMGAAPRHRLGIASGLLVMMRNMGMVTGMAVASAVFSGRMAMYSAHLAGHPGPAAFLAALGDTYRVAAGISAVGVVTSLVRGQQARNS